MVWLRGMPIALLAPGSCMQCGQSRIVIGEGAMKRMVLLALAGGLVSGAAQAVLHDRGGGLVYDDVLDVT